MEVKKGYKQTDIGLIPSDWEVRKIKEIAPLQRGFDLPNQELIEGDYPVVYSNGVQNRHNKFQVKAPGIVTGRSGTIGKVTFVEENYWPHNTSLWVTNFKNNEPKYIFYLFLKTKLERFATGSGVPTLNRNDVHDFQIAIPPLAEQTAIATALSDADSYIVSLEKLIAKKRLIKQGAMQQLLKPKEGWMVKKIQNVITELIDNRGKTPPYTNNPSIELIETNAISFTLKFPEYSKVTKFVSESVFRNWFRGHPQKNDILVSTVGEYSGSTAIMEFTRGTIAQNLISLRINENMVDSHFVFYWSRSTFYENQINQVMMNQAQPSLRVPWLLNFEISFPKEKAEQKSISIKLSDMDTEIAILEKQLSKAQSIKQGMMQQLLTGKIRLV